MLPTPAILRFPTSRVVYLLSAQPNLYYTAHYPIIRLSHKPVVNYGTMESLDAWKHLDTSQYAKNQRSSAEKHQDQAAPKPLRLSRGA